MKAAVLVQLSQPLEVTTVDIPSLDVGQVLVQVEYSGICGKQLDEIDGRKGEDQFLPHLLGHEGAGTVVEAGPGVRKIKTGDRVVLHWVKGSGIDSTTPTFRRNGSKINAGWCTTFSEYTVASENRMTVIPNDVGFDVAALLGCAVTTGLGIVFNDLGLAPGQSVAVFGAGGVGMNVIQGAALVNAYPIVAIDLQGWKLRQAMEFGATHTINAAEDDPVPILRDLSEGQGFNATVDLTGNSEVRQTAYNTTSKTGKTILAGVPHHAEMMEIDSFPLHFGRRIFGTDGGQTWPDVDIPRYLRLYGRGKLMLKEQITHRIGLDDINHVIDLVREGTAGRCLISMRD